MPAVGLVGALAILLLSVVTLRAADHGDMPLMDGQQRTDANISDFFAFIRGDNLVLAMSINPFLPPGTTEFMFPTDVTYRFSIDRDSEVTFDDPVERAAFGGSIPRPENIQEDIVFEITFDDKNQPQLRAKGVSRRVQSEFNKRIRLFAGVRAETFMFMPFVKGNIAAIVIEVPLDDIRGDQDTLLLWTTASVATWAGPFQERAGRALRSMFEKQLNTRHPNQHKQSFGVPPDVLILKTGAPVVFPNGRKLQDDVVDILAAAGDNRGQKAELSAAPRSATVEDMKPSLNEFPYLAPPN